MKQSRKISGKTANFWNQEIKLNTLSKVLGGVTLVLIFVGLPMWYVYSVITSVPKINYSTSVLPSSTFTPSPTLKVFSDLVVKNDKILERDTVLFTNVVGVNGARVGPDGGTIHFKIAGEKDQAYCADFKNSSSFSNSSLAVDYKTIAHYGSIAGCGENGKSGGYLKNSDHFTYLKINKNAKFGFLVFEDLLKDQHIEIPVDFKLFSGFFDGSNTHGNSYWTDGIQGIDGFIYLYPQIDSFLVNGKIAVAFGRLVLVADINNKKLLMGLPIVGTDYKVIANAFWFVKKMGSPIVLIQSSWEGYSGLEALIDTSSEAIKVINLNSLQGPIFDIFDIKSSEWQDNKVILRFYKVLTVTDNAGIDQGRISQLNEANDDTGITKEEEKARIKLLSDNKYYDVKCYLKVGQYTGCYAATDIKTYQYVPGGNLERIN